MPKAEKLTDLPIDEARGVKWRRGRERYGPVFVGQPLEQLEEELLDAVNYAEEAARRGYSMSEIAEDLRRLCERVWAVCRAAGRVQQRSGTNPGGFRMRRDAKPSTACARCSGQVTANPRGYQQREPSLSLG
jgi:hypothetical protein